MWKVGRVKWGGFIAWVKRMRKKNAAKKERAAKQQKSPVKRPRITNRLFDWPPEELRILTAKEEYERSLEPLWEEMTYAECLDREEMAEAEQADEADEAGEEEEEETATFVTELLRWMDKYEAENGPFESDEELDGIFKDAEEAQHARCGGDLREE